MLQLAKAGVQPTWQAAAGVCGEPREQQVADAVHLDLVLHAEALEALPSVEYIPAGAAASFMIDMQAHMTLRLP